MSSIVKGSSPHLGLFSFGDIEETVDRYASSTNQSVSIVHTHIDWGQRNDDGSSTLQTFEDQDFALGQSVTELAAKLDAKNTILAVSWDPLALDYLSYDTYVTGSNPVVSLDEILSGANDAYIRQVAQQVAAMDIPIMMSLFGEADAAATFGFGADGETFRGTTDDTTGQYGDPALLDGAERVRDVFQHVIDIFRQEGADNVTWYMYTSTDYTAADPESIPKDALYPGDDYIDWVGQSVYVDNADQLSASLDEGYNDWQSVTDKPFFVPELGTKTGGQEDWQAILTGLASYENLGAAAITSFEGYTEIYSYADFGTKSGDWQAIENSTEFTDVVMVDTPEGVMTYDIGRDSTGSSTTDSTSTDSSGTDVSSTGSSGADSSGTDTSSTDSSGAGNSNSGKPNPGKSKSGKSNTETSTVEAPSPEPSSTESSDTGSTTTDTTTTEAPSTETSTTGASGTDTSSTEPVDTGTTSTEPADTGTTSTEAASTDALFTGTAGADYMVGSSSADTMIGLGGDDIYIVDASGDAVVETDTGGNDSVFASVAHTLAAFVENLFVTGNSGAAMAGNDLANTMAGDAGNNNLNGGGGDDTLAGDAGADQISGGIGADWLSGGLGNDQLWGGQGDDFIEGGIGNDTIQGGSGADVLLGDDGNDRILLNGGADYALGGSGADTFVLGAVGDMAMIEDFDIALDVLDLTEQPINSRAALISSSVDLDGTGILIASGNDQLVLSGITANDLYDINLLL